MKVSLIAHTSDPVKVLWTAARVCKVEDSPPQELFSSAMLGEDMLEVLRRVWQAGHLSVFEHVNLTYAISNISRVCLAEFTRHRVGITYSVKGQRMPLDVAYYMTPPSIYGDPYCLYQEAVHKAILSYKQLLAAGVPAEDARYVLPQATVCNLVCTVNLRELNHLWNERGNNPHAHWEVRSLVRNMIREAVATLPWLEKINDKWTNLPEGV